MNQRERNKRRREAGCPLGLLRSCRKLAGLAGREVELTEFEDCWWGALVRVESVEPGWVQTEEDGGICTELLPAGRYEGNKRRVVHRIRELRSWLHRMPEPAALRAEGMAFASALQDLELALGDPRMPLTVQERRIWDLLLTRPEDRPLTYRQIVARLRKSGARVSEANARRSLSTTLKARGVRNRRNAGYYIPEEFRPSSEEG